jgi:hypothetical protein
MATRKDIFKEHLKAWLKAKGNRKMRREITKHVCFIASVHPKSVPRAFRRAQMRSESDNHRRGPKTTYGPDVTAALKEIWDIAGEPCAENVHSLIAEYVAILQRDGMWHHNASATTKLLVMSLGTMKKRVAKFRRISFFSHGKSTTTPGTIHSMIPLRSGPWNEAPVGTMQIDTVAHCGASTAGDYVFTVNSTDVATLWGTRRCQWNKGQVATVRSMEAMDDDTPFPVVEWHPDSGSEFVNWHCFDWSVTRKQRLTRSRPNHKNDNCFVEERNGHVVRRWVKYARFDVPEIVDALNAVYDVLTPYLNHFMASKRTTTKERIESKWRITRETTSMTPYQRVMLREDVSLEVKTKLKLEHDGLNPFVLKGEIDRRLKRVFDMQKRHEIPATQMKLQ